MMATFDRKRGVLITEDAARRIARAVQRINNAKRDSPGIKLRTAYDDGGQVQIGRTTEPWLKDTTTELEMILEDSCEEGSGGSGGPTLEAHNLAYDVKSGVRCVVAQATNGCWYLIEAESCPDEGSGSGNCDCPSIGGQDLTWIPGYSANTNLVQVLGHQDGCLLWISTKECDQTEEEE